MARRSSADGDWKGALAWILFGAGVGTAVYRVYHPKCPKCGAALKVIGLAERTLCPQCAVALTGIQALLALA
jgi:hypothetical protein